MSLDRRMDKENNTHTQWNVTQLSQKNELVSSTWMDLEIVPVSEGCKIEKQKYPMASLTCGI